MKKYRKEKYKTREEWLSQRVFGGSSVSALFNASPYMTALDVYCASVNPCIEKDTETASTIYGSEAEPLIRELVKINFKDTFKVQSPNGFTMYRRIDKPYMTATLDGVMTNITSKEKWVLEIKTHDVKNKQDLENWENHLPQNYYIQGLHYLAVLNDFVGVIYACKLRFYDYFNENGKKLLKEEIRYYYLKREDYEKDINLVEETETKFQTENIEKRIPPTITIQM